MIKEYLELRNMFRYFQLGYPRFEQVELSSNLRERFPGLYNDVVSYDGFRKDLKSCATAMDEKYGTSVAHKVITYFLSPSKKPIVELHDRTMYADALTYITATLYKHADIIHPCTFVDVIVFGISKIVFQEKPSADIAQALDAVYPLFNGIFAYLTSYEGNSCHDVSTLASVLTKSPLVNTVLQDFTKYMATRPSGEFSTWPVLFGKYYPAIDHFLSTVPDDERAQVLALAYCIANDVSGSCLDYWAYTAQTLIQGGHAAIPDATCADMYVRKLHEYLRTVVLIDVPAELRAKVSEIALQESLSHTYTKDIISAVYRYAAELFPEYHSYFMYRYPKGSTAFDSYVRNKYTRESFV